MCEASCLHLAFLSRAIANLGYKKAPYSQGRNHSVACLLLLISCSVDLCSCDKLSLWRTWTMGMIGEAT